jgi:PP-loop superfamily ATP-utilizing enzyme
MTADPRIAEAERLLAAHGVFGAAVSVEGHEREIAALRVPDGAWARMMGDDGAAIAAAVRALGFRYVALDLAPTDETAAARDGG